MNGKQARLLRRIGREENFNPKEVVYVPFIGRKNGQPVYIGQRIDAACGRFQYLLAKEIFKWNKGKSSAKFDYWKSTIGRKRSGVQPTGARAVLSGSSDGNNHPEGTARTPPAL